MKRVRRFLGWAFPQVVYGIAAGSIILAVVSLPRFAVAIQQLCFLGGLLGGTAVIGLYAFVAIRAVVRRVSRG